MAKRAPKSGVTETTHYQHDGATRKNIPSASMEAEGTVPKAKRVKYAYSPHLDPVLRFDPSGRADKVAAVVEKACQGEKLTAAEQEILRAVGKNWEQPWLEWAGKQEEHARGHFTVDPVALHIHERISAQAILRNAMREDAQRSLFGSQEQTYAEALQFYKHDVDWANRLILGDSLQVMTSLAQRENLAGKVQMIYMDPPYGIKFGSNFQPEVGKRDVKDGKDDSLTREPEMVRAYRDTWALGSHSFASYIAARLTAARELLASSGSVFVQISDVQLHRIRAICDEVFGASNAVAVINIRTMTPLESGRIESVYDYLVWYAKDKRELKYRNLFQAKPLDDNSEFKFVEEAGYYRELLEQEAKPVDRIFKRSVLESSGFTPSCTFDTDFEGRRFTPRGGRSWRTNTEGMARLKEANRLFVLGAKLYFKLLHADFGWSSLLNSWSDTVAGFSESKVYAVQTQPKIIQRCLLMTTDPGDLVIDPTCGSGTTAVVAEQWGRRWITTDTSRVAIAIARQRILTSRFDHYRTLSGADPSTSAENPASGFKYRKVPHVTLGAIAQNTHLDPIFQRHQKDIARWLERANGVLATISVGTRATLRAKLLAKEKEQGQKAISPADRRRWLLPPDNLDGRTGRDVDRSFAGWYEWEVPFDTDPDWPQALQDAVIEYRRAWRTKMDEVNKCIADNAEQEELVDQPEVVKGVVRVSGPFTVEGVIPEELSLGEKGVFDPTPNEFEPDDASVAADSQNLSAYLSRMLSHLKTDGLTFLNNQRKQFERLESLFDDGSGSFLHAEGEWKGEEGSLVAVTFGPQYGPVTALQVEEAIRAAKRYSDLVIAGFSFDAETYAIVEQQQHPKLRVHLAQIRPDLNESMDGLLRNTPNSQLFTVFGQPDIEVKSTAEGWVCELKGVDIYNPADNTLRSSGADKVAAWFLDSDYDGRCFCATQAFFPDRNAWEKIAKALGNQANADLFEAFNGTVSLPFEKGKFSRIAVKVIDPRGNEVMAIRRLN
ncbi:MAG: site-specific DNA-methyltransferase [Vicinamibacterales bacterium]